MKRSSERHCQARKNLWPASEAGVVRRGSRRLGHEHLHEAVDDSRVHVWKDSRHSGHPRSKRQRTCQDFLGPLAPNPPTMSATLRVSGPMWRGAETRTTAGESTMTVKRQRPHKRAAPENDKVSTTFQQKFCGCCTDAAKKREGDHSVRALTASRASASDAVEAPTL